MIHLSKPHVIKFIISLTFFIHILVYYFLKVLLIIFIVTSFVSVFVVKFVVDLAFFSLKKNILQNKKNISFLLKKL